MGKWRNNRRNRESEMRWGNIFRVEGDNGFCIRHDEVKEKEFSSKNAHQAFTTIMKWSERGSN